MKTKIGDATLTDAVVEVLETLQNQRDVTAIYLETIDELTRTLIVDLSDDSADADIIVMSRLRALQMMRRDIVTLSTPPDMDQPTDEIPAV
ncbi:MAG: hypothetical protein K2M06_04015 [Muribaculaceae bacterium]|nr:hypothetical protein [Muribaculaceae bacterium]